MATKQCDQMARLFVQYLAIYIYETLPIILENGQSGIKNLP